MEKAVELNELAKKIDLDIRFTEQELLNGYVIGAQKIVAGLEIVREIVTIVNPDHGDDAEFNQIIGSINNYIDMHTRDYEIISRSVSYGIELGTRVIDRHNPSNVKVYKLW